MAELTPLRVGEILVPPALLLRPGGPLSDLKAIGLGTPKRDRVWVPVPVFLIEHPVQGPVLIDTGLSERAVDDLRGAMGRIAELLYELRIDAGQPVVAQLRARGIDPGDVRTVVMTHLHFDHACGMRDLPNAEFVADAREWAATERWDRQLNGYHAPHFAGVKRRSVDFADGEPWGGFERTLDVFGDGSVRLLSTPGHTRGHMSVAVGNVLLTADLAYTRAAVFDGEPGLAADRGALRRSLAQLRAHLAAHPHTVVIPGHDPSFDGWA
jgi:N-acyl homoserine lactone hydrolase